jgi:hypothetical protein
MSSIEPIAAPWRSSIALQLGPRSPPYFAALPRSAPLLWALAQAQAQALHPQPAEPAAPLCCARDGALRLPLQCPLGPLADAVGEPQLLSVRVYDNVDAGWTAPPAAQASASSPASALARVAEQSFASSLRQSAALLSMPLAQAEPAPAPAPESAQQQRDRFASAWAAARCGDPTLLLPAASAPAAASPPQSVAVRFVVAQPLFPSAIPLPDSAGEALPACVVGAVGLLPRALRPAQTLREAALALLNQLAAAGALLLEPTGASASAGAGPDASARACGEEGLLDVEGGAAFELLLHGVSTREVPSLLGVAVGELSAALQHPDGFLYVALLQRARDRG